MGTLSISYTYDNNGNVLTMTDGTGTTTRTYDALNRTTSKTVPDIGTSFYVYDITADMPAGCTAETTTDPKGNITLKVYDPVGRLRTVTADGMTSTYIYNDNGSLATVLYGDGSREDYTYTVDNLPETLTNRKADNSIIDSYAYTYDAAHNLLSKTDSRGITSYTYDALNRLSSVTEPSGKVTTYTFDASGNRATQTVVLGTDTTVTTYTYDPLNRLLGTVAQLNGVTTENVTYTYDNNGNQLLQTHTAYIDGIPQTPVVKLTNTYDLFNQLITTVTADGVTVISTYNGDGLRVGKSVNGTLTRYLYEYQRVVLEVNVLGDQTGRNVYGINLLTRQVGADTFIYMYNGHADVTALLNTAGTIVATYYYDAFGNILDQTGVLSNNILYAGYQYDTETGLYYLNARMYDPVTARFMQEDTYTGERNDALSLNLYTYCHNEPLMYSDPTGHNEFSTPIGMPTSEYKKYKGMKQREYDATNNTTNYRPDWAYEGGEAPACTITNVAKKQLDRDGDGVLNISDATPDEPNEDIVYIFFERGDELLTTQADTRAEILRSNGVKVRLRGIHGMDDFIDTWNDMGEDSAGKIRYNITEVDLVFHGGPRSIYVGDHEQMETSGWAQYDTTMTPSDLDYKKIGKLNLSSCEGGNIDYIGGVDSDGKPNDNIASDFAVSHPEIGEVEAMDGSAQYGFFGHDRDADGDVPEIATLTNDDLEYSKLPEVNGSYRTSNGKVIYSVDVNGKLQVENGEVHKVDKKPKPAAPNPWDNFLAGWDKLRFDWGWI